jgi:TRAP-type C4-dicarboxylate transport system substrate-binding protein
MTRRFLLLAVLATALLLPAASPAGAAPKQIKLGTIVPAGSVWDKELRSLAAEVQKRTEGRVAMRIYPGGVAGDDPDIVRKMRLGQLQAATLTVDGLTELDDGFEVFSVPRFFGSFEELFHVAHELQPLLSQRLDKEGFVFLGWGYGGWVYLFSKEPVYTPADVKKLKLFVWAGDNRMVQWWKNNGFHPVPLASTDMMTGLQTGMIEALPAPPLAAVALQWYRQAPNMLELPFGQMIGATVISKKSWQQLTPADQAALRELAKQMQTRLEQAIPGQDRQSVEEMKRRGLTVTKPKDAAQMKLWEDAAAEFAQSSRENVPADVLEAARKSRDARRGQKP